MSNVHFGALMDDCAFVAEILEIEELLGTNRVPGEQNGCR